jgi:hypothetical protein
MVDPQHGAARINLATFFSGLYVRARGKIHDLVMQEIDPALRKRG